MVVSSPGDATVFTAVTVAPHCCGHDHSDAVRDVDVLHIAKTR